MDADVLYREAHATRSAANDGTAGFCTIANALAVLLQHAADKAAQDCSTIEYLRGVIRDREGEIAYLRSED